MSGQFDSVMDPSLLALPIPVYALLKAGAISKNLWTPEYRDISESKLIPLNDHTLQMLLGTLLGDGGMTWKGAKYGRFSTTHGWKQTEYALHKAWILRNYIARAPVIRVNSGFGTHSCVFHTQTSPVFEFLRPLMYTNGHKGVTQQLCQMLDWEAVAYWFMDDGGYQGHSAYFCTHAFTFPEVDLLAARLTEMGTLAYVTPWKKKGKRYPVLRLTVESSILLADKIRPYLHPTMLYKIKPLNPKLKLTCQFCSDSYNSYRRNVPEKTPTCHKPKCQKQRHLLIAEQWAARHREVLKADQRQIYQENLEASRKKGREKAARYRKDPVTAEARREYRRQWRRDRALLRPVPMTTCQFCGQPTPQKCRGKNCMVACAKPECKRIKHNLIVTRSRMRQATGTLSPLLSITLNTPV